MTDEEKRGAFQPFESKEEAEVSRLPWAGIGYSKTKAHAEELFDSLRGDFPNKIEQVERTLEYAIQLRRMQEHFEQFDAVTGAFTGDIFHADLGEYIHSLDVSFDHDLHIDVKTKAGRDYKFLAISPDNLQIINGIAGHDAGDAFLAETVGGIADAFESVSVSAEAYRVYREGAGNFWVRVSSDVRSTAFEQVKLEIANTQTHTAEACGLRYPPRNTVEEISLGQAVQIFNKAQDMLKAEGSSQITDEAAARKRLIGAMLTTLELQRETAIFYSLAETVVRDIWSGLEEGAGGKMSAEPANFYNEYVKRFFREGFLSDFSSIELAVKRARDEGGKIASVLNETYLLSLEAAGEKVFRSVREASHEEEIITLVAFTEAKKHISESLGRSESVSTVADIRKNGTHANQSKSIRDFDIFNGYPKGQITYERAREEYLPASVAGARYINEVYQELSSVTVSGSAVSKGTTQAFAENVKKLNSAFEKAGTSIPHMVSTPEGVVDVYEQALGLINETDPEKSLRLCGLLRELLSIETNIFARQHDELTGFIKRGPFYERLCSTVEEALKSGENVSVVFGDIEGLKNKNRNNGKSGGNLAIQMIGHSMEGAAEDLNAAGRCVLARQSGDEMIAFIPGSSEDALVFEEYLHKLTGEHRLPAAPEAAPLYEPTPIQLNVGICDVGVAMKAIHMMIERELYSKDDIAILNFVIERMEEYQKGYVEGSDPQNPRFSFFARTVTNMMVRISDRMVAYSKGFGKAQLLYTMYSNLVDGKISHETPEGARLWGLFGTMVDDSRKSLGNMGVEAIEALYGESGGGVLTRSAYEKIYTNVDIKEDTKIDDVIEQVIMDHVRELQYKGRLQQFKEEEQG